MANSSAASWYLPLAKGRPVADAALLGTLAETLRVLSPLLFPLVPIVTEEIRNHLSRVLGEPPVSLEDEPWPEPDDTKIDDAADGEMRVVIRIVRKVRNIRGLSRVPTGAEPVATVSAADESAAALLIRHSERIRRLAGVSAVVAGVDLTPPRGAAAGGVGEFQVFLSFGEEVDPRAEIDRLRGESYELVEQVRSSERRLQNRDFLERAPAEVVDRERIRRDGLADRLARIQQHIESLEDARK